MKIKTLCTFIAATVVFCSAAFGGIINLTGKVTAVSETEISLQTGKEGWVISRTDTTKVTSGKLDVGATVTIQCVSTDAHKNE